MGEVFVKINGERPHLWRSVDAEGEVLERVVTKRRNKDFALKMFKILIKRYGPAEKIVADRLRFYGAAPRELGCPTKQETGRWLNNRAENSHQPFRRKERTMQRFRQMRSLQKFASVHSSVFNHFNQDRSHKHRAHFKQSRTATLIEWHGLLKG